MNTHTRTEDCTSGSCSPRHLLSKVKEARKCIILLGILILQVHALAVIPQRESMNMRRRHIFSLLDCGQCNGIVHGSRMAIDSLANDWL